MTITFVLMALLNNAVMSVWAVLVVGIVTVKGP